MVSFWRNNYRVIIYLLTFLSVWVGLIMTAKLKINASAATRGLYDALENLPETHAAMIKEDEEKLRQLLGDEKSDPKVITALEEHISRSKINTNGVVLLNINYNPGSEAELTPMSQAVCRHAFRRGAKLLINVGYDVMSQPLAQKIISDAALDGRSVDPPYPFRESGVDYLFFGFRPNAFQVYLQMGESITAAYETDYSGRDTSSMPIMRGIKDFSDIDLVVTVSSFVGGPEMWINVGKTKFNKPVASGMTAVSASDYYPYLQSGQLCGLLSGLRGAAEYEALVGVNPAPATRRMWAQLYIHTFAILLIIIGNIEYLFRTKK